MTKNLILGATVLASASVAAAGMHVVRPLAVQTYADAYAIGSTGHFLLGTSDPNGASCFAASSCPAGDTAISRAAYVGSFSGDGNDMVAVMVFDADQLPGSGQPLSLHLGAVQNFTGQAYNLQAKILTVRGDGLTAPGAQGIFDKRGPFGIPTARSLQTVIVDGRGERAEGELVSGVTVGGGTVLVPHPADPGAPYLTYDNHVVLDMPRGTHDAIQAARESGVEYTACRSSCLGAVLQRNIDCNPDPTAPDAGLNIKNPLYIALSAVRGDARSSAALQANLAVDNIIHICGDCDFSGEPAPYTTSTCSLVWAD